VAGRARRVSQRDELYELAKAVDWNRLFKPMRTLRVDLAATRSPLSSLEFATLKVKDAVCDRFRADTGARPSIDKDRPDVRVHAYLTEREATLYLDTQAKRCSNAAGDGRRMSRRCARISRPACSRSPAGHRGRRCSTRCAAPARSLSRPRLAAADIAARPRSQLRLSEARVVRRPTWQRLRQRARDRARAPPAMPSIFASDSDPRAVAQCQRNAAAAKVDAMDRRPRGRCPRTCRTVPAGLLVANPPYGVRLEDEGAVAAFYPKLGDALKQRYAGWAACLLSGDSRLPKLIGLKPSRRTPLYNGAIECRLYRFEMVSGARGADTRASESPAGEC
jgi:putative N6-adenine-specific DNA methylase